MEDRGEKETKVGEREDAPERERVRDWKKKKKEETLCAKSKSCNMRSIYLCYGASRDSRQLHRCSQPYPRPKDATERQKKKNTTQQAKMIFGKMPHI